MIAQELLMPPPLLTLEEAAQQLKTSTWTVRRWIREGKLRGVRIGGTYRVDPADLAEFIRKGKTTLKEQEESQ